MTERLPWKYETHRRHSDGKWCVFVVHDETPEWFRLIAEFMTEDRALSYCGVENDIVDDGDAESCDDVRPAVLEQLPSPPQSAVTAANLKPRQPSSEPARLPSPAEKARVGAHLIDTAAQETGGETYIVTVQEGSFLAETLLPSKSDKAPRHNDLSADTDLERCDRVLRAIKAYLDEHDAFPSQSTIATRSGVPAGSLITYLTQLEDRGEIAKNAQGCRYLLSRPDRPAAPKFGPQAAAVQSATKARPEAAALVSAAKTIQPRKEAEPISLRQEIEDADLAGKFNHQMQRRCQSCNAIFKTDSIKVYLCDQCDSQAARA